MKLSVLMPAYNKGEIVFEAITKVKEVLEDIGMKYEIVVVDDGSEDNTLKEIRRAEKKFENVKVVHYDQNRGKGHALKYGFEFTKGDLVFFQDADTDLHPKQLKVFLEYMKKNNADVVIGSKKHPESKVNYSFNRRFLSWGYHMIIYILFNLHVNDTQVGSKLFKREVLGEVFPKIIVKRWAFDLEILVNVNKLGYKIVEAPIDLKFKHFNSTIDRRLFSVIKNMLIDTLAIFYRDKILKYYDEVN